MTQSSSVITIDGPSGVGKGTISKMLATHLGWHFLDSGALYRLTAYAAKQQNLLPENVDLIADLAKKLVVRFVSERILLGDTDVTDLIRQEEIGNFASKIAVNLAVREALDHFQRSFLKPPGLVADGRDMGTEIFPDAVYKFFLTARSEERARRRFVQLQASSFHVNMADLLREIEERDQRDKVRLIRPLRPAHDAVIIDTSALSIDAVFNIILARLSSLIIN